jgi:hypothetical protein
MTQKEPIKMEDLVARINELKKGGPIDLSMEEDLAIAIMNLISLEEHLCFTGLKTGKDEYFGTLDEIREMRKTLLAKMIEKNEGETWCTCKHLLSATMRLIEVGTKLFSDGKKEEAKEMYGRAHKLFSIFWALRLKLIDLSEVRGIAEEEKPWTLTDIMDKMVDCCKE